MPAVGQGEGKLCPRPATAGDLAIRSRYFRSKMSLLSGSHPQNITLATPMSCPISNFAKGSLVDSISSEVYGYLTMPPELPYSCEMSWNQEAICPPGLVVLDRMTGNESGNASAGATRPDQSAASADTSWSCHIVVALKGPFRPSLVGQADQTTGPVSRDTTDRSATGTRASNPKKTTCRLGLAIERCPSANSVAPTAVQVPIPSTVAESSPPTQNTRQRPRLSIPRSPTGSAYVSCCRSPQPRPQNETLGRPYG